MRKLFECPAHCHTKAPWEDQLEVTSCAESNPPARKELHPPTLCKHRNKGPGCARIQEVSEPAVHYRHSCRHARTPPPRLSRAGAPSPFSIPTKSPMRGTKGRAPTHASALGHGVLGRTERFRGPQLLQTVRAALPNTSFLNPAKLVLHLCRQLTGSPGGARTGPAHPAVQTWRPGQSHVEPELGDTWGLHRRTLGWGTRDSRAQRGWRHVEGPSKCMWDTQGHCLARSQARARPGRGSECGPTLHGSWSQGSSQAARCQCLHKTSTQRAFIPWTAVTVRAKGWKCGQLTWPGFETFLAN